MAWLVVPPFGLFYQPPTLPYSACLCPPLVFKSGGEKSPHLLVDLHLPGAGSFHRPILCLATQFLRWPWLSRGGEKRGGPGGLSPAQSARRTAGRSACPADSRNRQNPYPDTVENGTALGNSGIHDTQFDAKAPKPTPKNRKIDPLQKSRSGRLCRPL